MQREPRPANRQVRELSWLQPWLWAGKTPFQITWLSESGLGNRNSDNVPQATLPNWCDPAQPIWTPSPFARLFADLNQQVAKRASAAVKKESESELLVSGLKPDDLAILVPEQRFFYSIKFLCSDGGRGKRTVTVTYRSAKDCEDVRTRWQREPDPCTNFGEEHWPGWKTVTREPAYEGESCD